jgi:diguanylate cyclase (GGDEF)-like protein
MIDADHFKDVNDTYGHLFGDHVLKKLGDLISAELRSTDRLFRYGGEEFLAIMNEISKSEVVKVVNRQMAAIRNHIFRYEDLKAKVTVSMGGAFFPEDAQNKVNLVKVADQALYRAKQAGRNRFECCFEMPVEVSDQSLEHLKSTAGHDLSKAVISH